MAAKKKVKPATGLENMRKVVARAAARMTAERELKLLERRYQVFALRTAGHTYQEIAATCKCSESTVRDDLVTIAARMASELAESNEENRLLQIARYDRLLVKYMKLAEDGVLGAAGLVLSIEAQRAKLLALNIEPTKKLDVSGIREYVGVNIDDV